LCETLQQRLHAAASHVKQQRLARSGYVKEKAVAAAMIKFLDSNHNERQKKGSEAIKRFAAFLSPELPSGNHVCLSLGSQGNGFWGLRNRTGAGPVVAAGRGHYLMSDGSNTSWMSPGGQTVRIQRAGHRCHLSPCTRFQFDPKTVCYKRQEFHVSKVYSGGPAERGGLI